MTSLLHISDNHGTIKNIECDANIVIHTGDLLPSFSRGLRAVEEHKQTKWIKSNAGMIRDCWVKGRPMILCSGNHDYVNVQSYLRDAGIKAYLLVDEMLTINGVKFYGTPWVPVYKGEWNFELHEFEIAEKLRPVAALIESGDIDIVLAHTAIAGYLDYNGQGKHCGSTAMANMICHLQRPLRAYLHGHIHESKGTTILPSGTLVSNMSQHYQLISL